MIEPLLAVRGLTAKFGAKRVLADIDLSIGRGEWFCLLGPNGSGKTTLLRCVSGQLTPSAGTVQIGGHSILKAPERAKRLLGYAHPPEQLPALLTGDQCLEVYAAAHDLPDIGREILHLADRFRLTAALDQRVDTYSLGMRQKLSALLALIGDPALIVLDEAFNGLDPRSALILKSDLQERVASHRSAVLLATHALDFVLRHASRAALLLDGRLVKTWDIDELEALQIDGAGALESAFADAARERVE
jgi:ABC-2 type transport system ATP-binding protein